MYEGYKIFGPYIHKRSNRRVIILSKENCDRVMINYSRYLMEIKLGRHLLSDEEVHHKDENTLNDSLDNLEVLNGTVHKKLHHEEKFDFFVCPECQTIFELSGCRLAQSKQSQKQGKAGPFCSKSCVGKWNKKQ